MIGAALEGKPYLTAPVSKLYCFGRPQDLAFQRSRSNLSQRNLGWGKTGKGPIEFGQSLDTGKAEP